MDKLGLVIVLVQFPPWPCPPGNLIFKGLRGGKAQAQEEIRSLVSVGPANLIELLAELPQNPIRNKFYLVSTALALESSPSLSPEGNPASNSIFTEGN